MSTFLKLCQEYRSEIGIPGDGPVTTVGQSGELAKVVRDIRDADMSLKLQWQDWKFMWAQFSTTTLVGSNWLTVQKPSDLGTWNTNSFYLDKNTVDAVRLNYVDYDTWRDVQMVGESNTGTPDEFTVRPDGAIQINPVPETVQQFTSEYWKKASPLTSDAQISIIPEEYHRLIIVRAKLIYAEREDAPEIMAGSSTEYENLLTGLEAAYLPAQGDGRQASVIRPRQMVVE